MPEKKPTPIALAIRHESAKEPPPELKSGWLVVVVLRQPLYGDMRTWVGEVQQCSTIGLRITSMDWMIGMCSGADFWFPWTDIVAIETYTDKHDDRHVDLGLRQLRYNGASTEEIRAHQDRARK